MKIFNQQIIEQFTNRCPEEVVNRVLDLSVSLITECIEELKQITPILNGEYTFKVVDEHCYDTSTLNSEISLFVAFKTPQLELNTLSLVNNKFKQFGIKFAHAWQSRKKPKHKKKKKKDDSQEAEVVVSTKYSIRELKQNIIEKVIKKIDKESYIQVFNYGIRLVSSKELGVPVNIYFVLDTQEGYKLYNSYTNKFCVVDFKDRSKNFNKKLTDVGENFVYMIRVFNNLFFTLYNYTPNQILMESLMYNVPDELYKGYSFYECFIKILNYLNNVNIKKFVSIVDNSKKLLEISLINENPNIISNMINNIEKHL